MHGLDEKSQPMPPAPLQGSVSGAADSIVLAAAHNAVHTPMRNSQMVKNLTSVRGRDACVGNVKLCGPAPTGAAHHAQLHHQQTQVKK